MVHRWTALLVLVVMASPAGAQSADDGIKAVAGAVRDTVQVPAFETVTIAFDVRNPGRWAFHCHNFCHMAAGMMTTIAYEGFT